MLAVHGASVVSKQLRMELPADYNDEDAASSIEGNTEDLSDALDLDVGQDADRRLQVDDIHVEEIELTPDAVQIEYVVEYSAYYGCDANFADEDCRGVTGRREGIHSSLIGMSTLFGQLRLMSCSWAANDSSKATPLRRAA